MNQDQYKQLSRWINAHADGLLDEKQQQTFEQAKAKNAAIRNELDCQSKLDEALRRNFEPPPAESILSRVMGSSESPPKPATARPKMSPWIWRFAAAAAVIVFAVGGWWGWLMYQDSQVVVVKPKNDDLPKQTVDQVYKTVVAGGFKPRWVCKDDREFATTYFMKLGQGMVFKNAPEGVAMVGLSYAYCLSPMGIVFLADVHGERVIVIADRASSDTKPTLPKNSNLHLFRRKVGKIVLYEVSPLDKKSVLDYFKKQEVTDEWLKNATYRPPK